MKISITVFYDKSISVTVTPSWLWRWTLGLLFGSTESTRAVYRFQYAHEVRWFYAETHREVSRRVADAIGRELALREGRDLQHERLVRR